MTIAGCCCCCCCCLCLKNLQWQWQWQQQQQCFCLSDSKRTVVQSGQSSVVFRQTLLLLLFSTLSLTLSAGSVSRKMTTTTAEKNRRTETERLSKCTHTHKSLTHNTGILAADDSVKKQRLETNALEQISFLFFFSYF